MVRLALLFVLVISLVAPGVAQLYRLHVGKVCVFKPDTFNDFYTLSLSQCKNSPIKAISTWENIVAKLGIR